MKLILPLLIFSILHISAFSQVVDISFEKNESEYQSLIGATHLTEGYTIEDWENVNIFLNLETPISLETNEGDVEFYSIAIYSSGDILVSGINPLTLEFVDFYIATFDEYADNTYNAGELQDHTEIYYLFNNNTSYIEYKNLTFADQEFLDSSPEARFNVIVSIDHTDGTLAYHYGPSSYVGGLLDIFNAELYIGLRLFYEGNQDEFETIGILANDPSNPDLQIINDPTSINWDGLDDFPAPNTVYLFSFGETTSQSLQELDFKARIFPNPGSEIINILLEDNYSNGEIDILNSIGQIIVSDLPFNSQTVNTKHWTPGLYTIRLSTNQGFQTIKWMKI